MPLVVLDPSVEQGSQNASPLPNSYVGLDEVRAFWADRNDDLIGISPQITADRVLTAALLRAADYMRFSWRLRWKGSLVGAKQPLDWPRRGVPVPDFFDPYFRNANVPFEFRNTLFFGEDEVPDEVKKAQIFLTRAALSDSTTVVNLQAALGRVTKREKLGGLEVEYADGDAGGSRLVTIYKDALGTVEPYLRPFSSGDLVRS
jgi:hypothetical protein